MNLEELWKILDKERSSSALQKLSNDFYEQVSEYIQELKDEKDKTDLDDPKAALIEDELNTARIRIESIFNKRTGKIINLASSKVSGLMAQPDGLIAKENEIFEEVVKIIERGRVAMLDPVLEGEKRALEEEFAPVRKGPTPAISESKTKIKDFALVRILKNIPTFVGVDGKNYTVEEEDIITLPLTNAEVLCKRGAALTVCFFDDSNTCPKPRRKPFFP